MTVDFTSIFHEEGFVFANESKGANLEELKNKSKSSKDDKEKKAVGKDESKKVKEKVGVKESADLGFEII